MEVVRSTVAEAVQWYRSDAWVAWEVDRMNIHELVEPLRNAVLPILRNDANGGVLFVELGDGDLFEGVDRLSALIGTLERLAVRAAKHAPRKRRRARPARTDL